MLESPAKTIPAINSVREPGSYQMCTRCVMDTTDTEIKFTKSGVCNHCEEAAVRIANEVVAGQKGKQTLEAIAARVKAAGRNRDYDCVIGVSGGVDSTMVAYHVKELGLRPLAVHLDNGWNSELAVHNIRETLDRLDIDLYTHVIDWNEFRDIQLSFFKASVPNCEIPTDHAINALLIRTAIKHRIRYIFVGSNIATEGIMPISWGHYNQDLKHLKAIHKRFGTVRMKTFPQMSPWLIFRAFFVNKIKWVRPLNYIDFRKNEAKELIQNELGWRDYGGKHYESIFTRFFQGYFLPTKFGFDKRKPHLSSMIASGEISRGEALRLLEKDVYGTVSVAEDKAFVVKKFGLTESEFDALVALPPKKHTDYPSNFYWIHEMQGLKRVIKSVATRV